jgi:hypothetical protein
MTPHRRASLKLLAGFSLALLGAFLVVDDAGDIGSFSQTDAQQHWRGIDFSWLPNFVHHWWIGLVLLALGLYLIYTRLN